MRASISSRFSAMNLDMIIFGTLWQAVSMLLGKGSPELMTPLNSLVLGLLASIFYFVYPTKKSGQTLGKKLLSLKVVPESGDKLPLSWSQAFLREVPGKFLSSIALGLGFIWAFTNSEHKTWHDSLGKTRVISLMWEEEKTFLQKLQHIMLGILSIPLGVALILAVFLYTPLPLNSIKEKIEASGIQVGTLSGSLAGGLHFSEIQRQDKSQSFFLGSVDVKCNLSALVYDRNFFIEKLTAEEGHIEVPENFTWATLLMNLMSLGQLQEDDQAPGIRFSHFKMAKLHLKNIFFEHDKKVLRQLQEFSVKNLEMADQELLISEAQFQTPGLTMKAQDFKSSFGRIEVANMTGGLGPDFLPLLKVPVDFHLNGMIGKNPKGTKIVGGMTLDKIKFTYENEKLLVNVDKLLLNEMFKTALPLDELNLKLVAQGEGFLKLMSSLEAEYGIKVCGTEFQPDAQNGPSYAREATRFFFKMQPKPVVDFGTVVFNPGSTLDDLFYYEVKGQRTIGADFSSPQEMLAELCYHQEFAKLQPAQVEKLAPLVKVTEASRFSSEMFQQAAQEARRLVRSGRYAEAKSLLDGVPLTAEKLSAAQLGAFYNLKAWVYLHSAQPEEALQAFEAAFASRRAIGDAEGLLRAHEALKNEQGTLKWLEYIKTALKDNPHLLNYLTPNLQKKLLDETASP